MRFVGKGENSFGKFLLLRRHSGQRQANETSTVNVANAPPAEDQFRTPRQSHQPLPPPQITPQITQPLPPLPPHQYTPIPPHFHSHRPHFFSPNTPPYLGSSPANAPQNANEWWQ